MQKTLTLGPHPLSLLANAVLHLAKALDDPCGIAGVGPSCEAARDLVRDLAAPDHAEKRSSVPTVGETQAAIKRIQAKLLQDEADRLDAFAEASRQLRPAGPVVTARLVDGRMTVFHDGVHAPDSPWQQAFDAQHQADRVMVRAVAPGHAGHDDELVEWDEWVLDPDAAGHRAPFSAGDLVMYSNGREGLHQVVAVSVNKDLPRHRSLRLRVKPTDVVIDPDAF